LGRENEEGLSGREGKCLRENGRKENKTRFCQHPQNHVDQQGLRGENRIKEPKKGGEFSTSGWGG